MEQMKQMKQMKQFILSDEGVDSHGFIVKTDGIKLDRFNANPVLLADHKRGVANVIGKWENIQKVDNKLIATPLFDENDEFAMKVKSKVDSGFLKGVSVGITILGYSLPENVGDPIVITSCEISEASIVDIPSNANALQFNLKYKNKTFNMVEDNKLEVFLSEGSSGEQTEIVNEVSNEEVDANDSANDSVNDSAKVAALETEMMINDAEAKANEVNDNEELQLEQNLEMSLSLAINKKNNMILELNKKLEDLSVIINSYKNKEKETYINKLISDGKFSNSQFATLMKLDTDVITELGNAAVVIKKPSVNLVHSISDVISLNSTSNWTLEDYREKDPQGLKLMQTNNPEMYNSLVKNYTNKYLSKDKNKNK